MKLSKKIIKDDFLEFEDPNSPHSHSPIFFSTKNFLKKFNEAPTSNSNSKPFQTLLNAEMNGPLVHIFQFLPFRDLLSSSLHVCNSFRKIILNLLKNSTIKITPLDLNPLFGNFGPYLDPFRPSSSSKFSKKRRGGDKTSEKLIHGDPKKEEVSNLDSFAFEALLGTNVVSPGSVVRTEYIKSWYRGKKIVKRSEKYEIFYFGMSVFHLCIRNGYYGVFKTLVEDYQVAVEHFFPEWPKVRLFADPKHSYYDYRDDKRNAYEIINEGHEKILYYLFRKFREVQLTKKIFIFLISKNRWDVISYIFKNKLNNGRSNFYRAIFDFFYPEKFADMSISAEFSKTVEKKLTVEKLKFFNNAEKIIFSKFVFVENSSRWASEKFSLKINVEFTPWYLLQFALTKSEKNTNFSDEKEKNKILAEKFCTLLWRHHRENFIKLALSTTETIIPIYKPHFLLYKACVDGNIDEITRIVSSFDEKLDVNSSSCVFPIHKFSVDVNLKIYKKIFSISHESYYELHKNKRYKELEMYENDFVEGLSNHRDVVKAFVNVVGYGNDKTIQKFLKKVSAMNVGTQEKILTVTSKKIPKPWKSDFSKVFVDKAKTGASHIKIFRFFFLHHKDSALLILKHVKQDFEWNFSDNYNNIYDECGMDPKFIVEILKKPSIFSNSHSVSPLGKDYKLFLQILSECNIQKYPLKCDVCSAMVDVITDKSFIIKDKRKEKSKLKSFNEISLSRSSRNMNRSSCMPRRERVNPFSTPKEKDLMFYCCQKCFGKGPKSNGVVSGPGKK